MSDHTPSSPPGATARRIDHVAIATHDATTAAAWYVSTFGMEVVGDEIVDSAGVRLVYLTPRGTDPDSATMVQLAEPVAAGNIRDFLDDRGEGMHHICFTVDHIEEVLQHVRQDDDGIFLGGRVRRACFLQDRPLGVNIELTETQPVSRQAVR